MLALEEVYDVTMVKDGQEAFDTVKANMEKGVVFDLIFMDIQVRLRGQSQMVSMDANHDRCRIWTACRARDSFARWDTRPPLWH
jgi:CheY-like chemotaxis protein